MTEEELVRRVAQAMATRRRELIGRPLEYVWDDLARAAIDVIKKEDPYADPDWV